MSLVYKIDILSALKAAGYNSARIREENLFSQSTLQKFRKGEIVGPDNLDRVCRMLNCQPGDILAYIPEE